MITTTFTTFTKAMADAVKQTGVRPDHGAIRWLAEYAKALEDALDPLHVDVIRKGTCTLRQTEPEAAAA